MATEALQYSEEPPLPTRSYTVERLADIGWELSLQGDRRGGEISVLISEIPFEEGTLTIHSLKRRYDADRKPIIEPIINPEISDSLWNIALDIPEELGKEIIGFVNSVGTPPKAKPEESEVVDPRPTNNPLDISRLKAFQKAH